MFHLFSFFEETGTTNNGGGDIWTWVIMGVMVVALVLLMVIPNRKRKKQAEEMMAKLTEGCVVTTIGGIVGTVVKLDDKNIWLETGTDDNKTVMQFVRGAIHSIAPAPGSPEAIAMEEKEKKEKEESEQDEIK